MPSLNYLQFQNIPKLKTLPDFLRKTPLQHLVIKYDCPHLKGIVKQRSGEEWAKISHVPNIQQVGRCLPIAGSSVTLAPFPGFVDNRSAPQASNHAKPVRPMPF
ncbi:hypothetical protein M0R45_010313 [Rubus argutus]|uniref:Uncharacterized protein n=1 Tax=Rubus argutus TaxID=59490 RepID=A0AAW1Y7E1_RUBAR